MPQGVTVVTGPPFAGKSLWIADEISAREEDGELGLVAVDFSGLYAATVPGVESSLRDEAVSDTGSPRFVGYLFEAAVAQIAVRELSGYIATNSPKRAVVLAERFGGRLVNIDIDVEELAERIDGHMRGLTRKVRRASREGVGRRCRDAAGRYLSEAVVLVGKARNVKRVGKQWRDTGPVKPFDRDNFRRGLTPAGKEVVAQLESDGDLSWKPIDVHNRILLARSY